MTVLRPPTSPPSATFPTPSVEAAFFAASTIAPVSIANGVLNAGLLTTLSTAWKSERESIKILKLLVEFIKASC